MPKLFNLHIITKVTNDNEILFLNKWNEFVSYQFIGDAQIFLDTSDAEVHVKFIRAMEIKGSDDCEVVRLMEYIGKEF